MQSETALSLGDVKPRDSAVPDRIDQAAVAAGPHAGPQFYPFDAQAALYSSGKSERAVRPFSYPRYGGTREASLQFRSG
jgi:hypothetical protein